MAKDTKNFNRINIKYAIDKVYHCHFITRDEYYMLNKTNYEIQEKQYLLLDNSQNI